MRWGASRRRSRRNTRSTLWNLSVLRNAASAANKRLDVNKLDVLEMRVAIDTVARLDLLYVAAVVLHQVRIMRIREIRPENLAPYPGHQLPVFHGKQHFHSSIQVAHHQIRAAQVDPLI